MSEKRVVPGDCIVAVGGRTGRDGIHGATFSSAELTHESESISGGAVQIGNAITEKMLLDVVLAARDRGLYHAITDCGAGGFSSAVGEMGADTGAEVWLEKPSLKYAGLSYTEIWISEAQERMVLAVPPETWDEFRALCASEGVEATVIGRFTDTQRLVLKYDGEEVGMLDMHFLHDGRPPVVREAVYAAPAAMRARADEEMRSTGDEEKGRRSSSPHPLIPSSHLSGEPPCNDVLKSILGSLNVCSKAWIIRQYDHEVQAGSVVKPLVGVNCDGPSDAAVVRPDLRSQRGLVIACGMNPRYGDFDPYWMAASAIDEAVRNCVAVGADPKRIAILDNFCWGNTDRPETLGALVRAALGCHDTAVAFGTPFVSGKDSLNNEFTYVEESGVRSQESGSRLAATGGSANGARRTIAIPHSLLITALGQIEDVERAVTMDLKEPGNVLFLVGATTGRLGGSHFALVHGLEGGDVPEVDLALAPEVFAFVHESIRRGLVRSCHDLSEGGLAVALAEMAFAGGLGVDVVLGDFRDVDLAAVLFSECNTRFLVETPKQSAEQLMGLYKERATLAGIEEHRYFPVKELGTVTGAGRVIVRSADGTVVIDDTAEQLKSCWKSPLAWD
jgi:phosphoribosylformylglycinamidine synthase